MAALQCEICGGKLIAKAGGLFECDSCGMQYDKTRIQEMVQQIKGTVKVEGTVQVAGTVKVDGPVEVKGVANVEMLLKRGWMAIEDRQFDEAKSCFNQVLQITPECGQAYFGLAMATVEYRTIARLAEASDFRFRQYIERARKYPDDKVLGMLQEYDALRAEKKQKSEQKKQQAEQERIHSVEQGRMELPKLRTWTVPLQKRIAVRNFSVAAIDNTGQLLCDDLGEKQYHPDWYDQRFCCLASGGNELYGIHTDGTVAGTDYMSVDFKYLQGLTDVAAASFHKVAVNRDGFVFSDGSNVDGRCDVGSWRDVKAVACGDNFTAGLHYDGTVVTTSKHTAVNNWTEIVDIAAGFNFIVGLRVDGTVLTAGGNCDTNDWVNVIAVSAGEHFILGLTKDGNVLYTGPHYDVESAVKNWTNLVAIQAGGLHAAGIRKDGTVLYTKDPDTVKNWKLFSSMEDIKPLDVSQVIPETPDLERKRKVKLLEDRKKTIQAELASLKGLFTGKRRKELEEMLSQVERNLRGVQ